MKELFDSFEKVGFEKKDLVLLDTCFIFDMLKKNEKLPSGFEYGLSSFTVEELLKVTHKNLHKMKVPFRRFLNENSFVIVETPVHPGDWEGEKDFVKSVDPKILQHVPDASDAVLLAVAVKTHSIVMAKDKHHLFTVELENFLVQYGIKVYKELKDLDGLVS